MSLRWSPWPFKPLRSTVISTNVPAAVAWQIVILPAGAVVRVTGIVVVEKVVVDAMLVATLDVELPVARVVDDVLDVVVVGPGHPPGGAGMRSPA